MERKTIKFKINKAVESEEKEIAFNILEGDYPLFFNFDIKREGREVFLAQPYSKISEKYKGSEIDWDRIIVCSLDDFKNLLGEITKHKIVAKI